jgi:hypothetical protein
VKKIPLHPSMNVAIMDTKAGIRKCSAFVSKIEDLKPKICCFVATGSPEPSATEVTDDETDDEGSSGESTTTAHEEMGQESDLLTQVNFQDQPSMRGVSLERDKPLDNDRDELYRLHVRTGHLSFSKLRAMARRRDIPSRLQHCESPLFCACQYGKATRKPWRTKRKNRKVKLTTFAGEFVSVDQSHSRAVWFVADLKGRLTYVRYTVATIFVDHYSRLVYVHLQKDASSTETVKAKRAFKLYARERGITIRHYHTDNGRIVDNAWKNGSLEANQGITYCGVNAHWQNGITERRIRDLKEQS